MNNSNGTPNDEEVMLAFSVEPDHGSVTLQRYIENYPHLANGLLDLALDLRLSLEERSVTSQDLEAPEIQSAWEQFNRIVFAERPKLTAEQIKQVEASLVSMPMREIGLPVSVLSAIRSGLVELEGFPGRWIAKIASTGGYATEMLRFYLTRPPTLPSVRSFKSEVKPQVGGKVTFRSLIESSTLTEAEKTEILRED
ncbi:hypothetical protein K32_44520 [Kaistia sp. 32K]|uniref:hypothetical protein n=1 Tax=Kaistia sp. 32K TaxID=2795690 RepID=UPI0019159827|nr:hypothetical protein [Kaistia sp. 32K]BCP55835.1 hypothetical protein K32_44520 [Kaistia sp. 32K]